MFCYFCLQNRNIIFIENEFYGCFQCLRFQDLRNLYLYSWLIMVDQVKKSILYTCSWYNGRPSKEIYTVYM